MYGIFLFSFPNQKKRLPGGPNEKQWADMQLKDWHLFAMTKFGIPCDYPLKDVCVCVPPPTHRAKQAAAQSEAKNVTRSNF